MVTIHLTSTLLGSVALLAPLPVRVEAHGFLLLPETKFTTDKKNFYATWVEPTKVPPESSYWTGDAEKNAANFKVNYAAGSWSSLKDFILTNQVMTDAYENRPSGGTLECGFSIPDATAQPLPDHLEYGNYIKDIIHPGPCEAWCDDEIVVAFQEDCRVYQGIDIPYDKTKCEGKSRLTFYWLATHFSPFQVYTSCVPLEGSVSSEASTAADYDDEDAVTTVAPAITTATPSFTAATATGASEASTAADYDDDEDVATIAPNMSTSCKRRMRQ